MGKTKVVEFAEAWTPGGVESYIVNIADGLDKNKFEVIIWATQVYADLYDADLERIGVKLYQPVEVEQYLNPIKRTLNGLKIFNRTIKDIQCDVFHLHAANGIAWIYAYLAKRNGKRVIFHAHASSLGNKHRFLKMIPHTACKTLFSQNADVRLACSEKAAEFLYPKKYSDDVNFITCIIDTEKFRFNEMIRREWRKNNNIDDKTIVFLNVGRLQNQKNHYFLLELFSEISKAVRGMLYIIGEGSELEGIKRRIVELGLREKVIMVGKTREVEKYMFMSDVFLLPSFHEGNPIVTAEAQAAGLPCYISDRVTKLAKLLEESKFIGIDDAKESASMIIKDIRNGAYLTDRKKAIDIVKESGYDRKIQVEQLEKIYMSV